MAYFLTIDKSCNMPSVWSMTGTMKKSSDLCGNTNNMVKLSLLLEQLCSPTVIDEITCPMYDQKLVICCRAKSKSLHAPILTSPGVRGMANASTEIGQVNTVQATGHKEGNTRYPTSLQSKEMRGSEYFLKIESPDEAAIVLYLLHQDCNSLKDNQQQVHANPLK